MLLTTHPAKSPSKHFSNLMFLVSGYIYLLKNFEDDKELYSMEVYINIYFIKK
jgi:hypothetical protein